ncbi:MAG: hypothetical protein LBT20_01695 [Clostridiales bacterium]|jgi:hypothetical protein|nr:hypothetical protein [Clostridiales bacterium]
MEKKKKIIILAALVCLITIIGLSIGLSIGDKIKPEPLPWANETMSFYADNVDFTKYYASVDKLHAAEFVIPVHTTKMLAGSSYEYLGVTGENTDDLDCGLKFWYPSGAVGAWHCYFYFSVKAALYWDETIEVRKITGIKLVFAGLETTVKVDIELTNDGKFFADDKTKVFSSYWSVDRNGSLIVRNSVGIDHNFYSAAGQYNYKYFGSTSMNDLSRYVTLKRAYSEHGVFQIYGFVATRNNPYEADTQDCDVPDPNNINLGSAQYYNSFDFKVVPIMQDGNVCYWGDNIIFVFENNDDGKEYEVIVKNIQLDNERRGNEIALSMK